MYPVICDNGILADYVTIQVIDDNAMLQINELELIIDNDGKLSDEYDMIQFIWFYWFRP